MRRTWFSPRAILLHLLCVVAVAACVSLCIWQYHRATGGNALSWAYVFEWPLFAGCAIYLWQDLVRHRGKRPAVVAMVAARQSANARVVKTGAVVNETQGLTNAVEEEEDPELAAYNRYLADLDANDGAKRW